MQLELSDEERTLLSRLAHEALKELRVEVRRTSTPDYHDRLKEDEAVLEGIIKRLDA